jgi:phosphoserine phosphatase
MTSPAPNPSSLLPRLAPRDLQSLLEVTRGLAAPFDLHAMLEQVAQAARRVLHAERASVWLLDEAAGELYIEVSADLPRVRVPLGRGLVGACAAARAPVNVPDCYADPRFNPAMDRDSGFRTRCLLALPLVDHRDALVGVLQILNRREGVFGPAEEALGQALAAQCAVALSRVRMTEAALAAERMRHELDLARTVQLATLPAQVPQLPGYAMAGLFRPAEQTGGDTWDLALLPGRGSDGGPALLVLLADATGHGIAPALLVTQMHAMLRMALRLGASLETAFVHLNDQLAATVPDGRFVATAVALLDPATHRLRLLSGGQGPILHLHAATGECSAHRATSFPLGAAPITRLRSPLELQLQPGDLLALLSDGVFEYEDAQGAQLGREPVIALLRDHRAGPMPELAARILDAALAHGRGAPQQDDITMVLLRRDAATDPADPAGPPAPAPAA